MNLAFEDLKHHLGRFILTCLGIGLLLGVVLAMIGIYRGLVDDALSLPRSAQADLWVVEAGRNGPFAEASRLPGHARDTIAALDGVAQAGGVLYQLAEATLPDGATQRLFLVGHEIDGMGAPADIVAGRGLVRSHYEIVIDRSAGLPLGTILRLGRHDFTIVGHTKRVVNSAGDPVGFLSLQDAQALSTERLPAAARAMNQESPDASINAVVARLVPGTDAQALAAQIRQWKHMGALTAAEQDVLMAKSFIEKVRKQIGMFAAILVVVATVVIALIVYTMTMDKVREIATLKLIGAPDRLILGMIVQQSLALGVLGYGAGAALMLLGADFFPRRVILTLADGAALGAVTIAACLLASLLAVRLALRIEPAKALHG